MADRTVARRYAKGLLAAARELGAETGRLRQIATDLRDLAEIVGEHKELRFVIANRAVDSDQRAAVLTAIAERLPADTVTKKFLRLLAEKERLDQLEPVAVVFAQLVDEVDGVVRAEITTPQPLGETAIAELGRRFSEATSRKVRLTATTDPHVLGGVVTRIGDVIYDGSLRRQLARIHQRLTEG